jgi:hypothetical protein
MNTAAAMPPAPISFIVTFVGKATEISAIYALSKSSRNVVEGAIAGWRDPWTVIVPA